MKRLSIPYSPDTGIELFLDEPLWSEESVAPHMGRLW